MLHTVNKSHPNAAFERAFELATSTSGTTSTTSHSLLLMEEGVYQALATHPSATALRTAAAAGVKIYALKADVEARGLSTRILPEVRLISDTKWVQLVAEQEQTIAWF